MRQGCIYFSIKREISASKASLYFAFVTKHMDFDKSPEVSTFEDQQHQPTLLTIFSQYKDLSSQLEATKRGSFYLFLNYILIYYILTSFTLDIITFFILKID